MWAVAMENGTKEVWSNSLVNTVELLRMLIVTKKVHTVGGC